MHTEVNRSNSTAMTLLLLLFVVLSLMKFRLVGIPLSDCLVLIISGVAFVKTGELRISIYALLILFFAAVCMALSVTQGSLDGMISSVKLFVPFLAIVTLSKLASQLNVNDILLLARRILFFGVWSQLIIVAIFYSGIADSLFNVVLPGNEGREDAGFKINVFTVPFAGVYRFGGLFIEPSWYSMFFGFFMLMYFYLMRQNGDRFSVKRDIFIITAFLTTLSFTATALLIIAYCYRFFDLNKPVRLVIVIPAIIALLVWVMLTNDYLAHRIYLIASGNDNSINARIFASADKAWFILQYTSYIGAGPAETLKLINQFFSENLSIQNAYLEAFASVGLIGGGVFVFAMHISLLKARYMLAQLPLVLALLVSSIVFTPILWMLAFFTHAVVSALCRERASITNFNTVELNATQVSVVRS